MDYSTIGWSVFVFALWVGANSKPPASIEDYVEDNPEEDKDHV